MSAIRTKPTQAIRPTISMASLLDDVIRPQEQRGRDLKLHGPSKRLYAGPSLAPDGYGR